MGPDRGLTPCARQLLGSERARSSSRRRGRRRRVGRDIPYDSDTGRDCVLKAAEDEWPVERC
jgi:hypothetical protein